MILLIVRSRLALLAATFALLTVARESYHRSKFKIDHDHECSKLIAKVSFKVTLRLVRPVYLRDVHPLIKSSLGDEHEFSRLDCFDFNLVLNLKSHWHYLGQVQV